MGAALRSSEEHLAARPQWSDPAPQTFPVNNAARAHELRATGLAHQNSLEAPEPSPTDIALFG